MDTNWLKDAQEHFREAMDNKDWDTAKALVGDVLEVDIPAGRHMSFALSTARMEGEPSAPHGYVLGFLKKKNEEYKAKGLVPTLDMLISDLTQ